MTDTTFDGRQQYAIAESQTVVFETVSFSKRYLADVFFSTFLYCFLSVKLFAQSFAKT